MKSPIKQDNAQFGKELVDAAKKAGIEVKTVKVIITPEMRRRSRDVANFIADCKRFEQESRKANYILKKGL